MKLRPSWSNWKVWPKIVGLLFLVPYFWQHSLQIDFIWVVAYVGLAAFSGLVFALLINPVLTRIFQTQDFDPSPYAGSLLAQAKCHPWIKFILLIGEDGFFFVPILLLGINPVTAAITAILYAAFHYPEFPIKYCVVKAVLVFLIITLILPNGLGSVIVGHLVLDALAYRFLNPSHAPESTDRARL